MKGEYTVTVVKMDRPSTYRASVEVEPGLAYHAEGDTPQDALVRLALYWNKVR